MKNEITIILDNAGGITVQVNGTYQVTLWKVADAAQLIKDAALGADPRDWDGNEIEENGLLEPSDDALRNGGYNVLSYDDLMALDANEVWGRAGQELRAAL